MTKTRSVATSDDASGLYSPLDAKPPGNWSEAVQAAHPILLREYTVPTPMMKRAYNIVRETVWARRTGVVFYASPRAGKTRCAFSLKDQLSKSFPNVYLLMVSARRATRDSDGHLPRLILEASNHALASRAPSSKLFSTAVNDIRVNVNALGGTQVVLLIDEIQLLSDCDLQQLVCIQNSLELGKVKMTAVSFAQPAIIHRRTALLVSNDHQIIARLLSNPVSFKGCSSADDLQAVLMAYDEHSEYPEESQCSYTRFFFPIAFDNGFRLAAYYQALWSALAHTMAEASSAVSMELVCLTIEHLLLALKGQDGLNFSLSDNEITSAVASCSFYASSEVPSD